MSRRTTIDAEYCDQIDDAVDRFGDHEGLNRVRILKWLEQFADEHLSIADKLLRAIRYYDASSIRQMTRQLLLMLLQDFQTSDLARVVCAPVGGPGSGSQVVARAMRDLIRTHQPARPMRMVALADLARFTPGQLKAVVFLDDFSGTGNTLADWWPKVEPLVRPLEADVYIALLAVTSRARDRIEAFATSAIAIDELGDGDNVLANGNPVLDPTEREVILEYCRRTGCGAQYVRGYGALGLLLAFRHGCPNNSLPILWCSSISWRSPLFKRRAI